MDYATRGFTRRPRPCGNRAPGKSASQALNQSDSTDDLEADESLSVASRTTEGIKQGDQVRIDSPVTESHTLSPEDGRLLRNCARVLTRLLNETRKCLGIAVVFHGRGRACKRRKQPYRRVSRLVASEYRLCGGSQIFVKQPGLGGSVAWHQDGVTHWGSPDWDEGIHGFNFQVQLYPTAPASCLWVVPGTHKLGKIDIEERVHGNGGSEQLPGALPLVCDAGDVTIVNRQMLHASFANTSSELRISLTFGFHRRSSVEGQKGALGVEADEVVHDAQRIFDRSSVIAVAIDARRQYRPGEPSFVYQPFAGLEDDFRFNDETFERVIRDYNLNDLAI